MPSTWTPRTRQLPDEGARRVAAMARATEDIEFTYDVRDQRARRRSRAWSSASTSVRRHPAELSSVAFKRDRLGGGARGSRALPERRARLPVVPRHAAAPSRRATCSWWAFRQRPRAAAQAHLTRSSTSTLSRRASPILNNCTWRARSADIADKVVREIRSAPHVPQQRGPELPEPGSQRRHPVGRRGPAHPSRVADRLRPDRRDVRAGRTLDRAAPARQRPPDRHAAPPARPRQLACMVVEHDEDMPSAPSEFTSSTWARAPDVHGGQRDRARARPDEVAANRLTRSPASTCRAC